MNIVIDIASLDNRGDWLMFEATYEQVLKRFPFAHVAVPEKAFLHNQDYFRQKGVMYQIDEMSVKRLFRMIIRVLRHRDISYLRFMTSYSVDLLLFTPGFRFSDQFNITADNVINEEISHFRSFSKKGRKIVFLPQAFGPFETQTERRHVTECCREANHIYAREKTSYNHLMEVLGESDKVSIAPDFTCLYHGEKFPLAYQEKKYVVVIPNRQMLVRSKLPSKYCDFMVCLVRFLHARKENVVLLNHEANNDIGLIDFLNAAISNQGVIVSGVSGGACKSVIARAKLVVTSRFHGLVSALSEGVPVICTSWSHKYQELVTEMGCKNSCLDMYDIKSAMEIVIDSLNHPERYSASCDVRQKWVIKIEQMWDEVFKFD